MADVLQRIEAYKREEIAAAKRACPLASLRQRAADASLVRPEMGRRTVPLEKKGYPSLIPVTRFDRPVKRGRFA